MQKALRNTIALITATWLSLLALPVQPALADLFINIHQDGNDVNMYWGGSITFTRARGYATRFVGPTGIFVNKITTDPGEINLLGAFTGIDLECPCADIFASVAGLNGKSQTLVGGKFNLLSSSGVLLLPKEYESGQVFSGTLKLHNVSINDYVLKTDVYKFKPDWSNDKIYITVVQEPNVTLTSTASSQVNGSYPMKATFSTDVYGFTASDIVVDNGTVSNFKQVSGRVYTFDVTPSQDGTVTVTVPANVATDRVGGTQADNNNQASKPYSLHTATPKTAFSEYKDEIKRIIQDQAQKRLTTLMNDNSRMMQDARGRFIGFTSGADGEKMGLTQNGFEVLFFIQN